MKIAIISYNLDWPTGGPRLIFSYTRALQKLGHEVIIYAPHFTGEYFKELWNGLDIRIVAPKYPFIYEGRPGFFKWVWRKFKQERLHVDTSRKIAEAMDADFDIVNLHDYAYRLAPFYKKRNPKAKILWTANEPPYVYLPKKNPLRAVLGRIYNAYRDWSGRKCFKSIDATVILDKYNRKWFAERGIRAEIVRLGVDFADFYVPVRNFDENAKKKKVRLLGIGALNGYRRYDDTINAVRLLRKEGYDASAYIICNDTWHESECKQELLDLVRDNNLENIVKLNFSGATESEMHEAHKNADVFVYAVYVPPPRGGFGFSMAVVEAMAAGLPVVLCRTTTSNEILEDGKTALLVDPRSPEQIAGKVKMLVDNPDIYKRISEAGQRLVEKELTWDNYAKKTLEAVYGNLSA